MIVHPYSEDAFLRACASSHFTLERLRGYDRAAYLHRYLAHQGAATIVVEDGYTDGDYLDDFANYYVKSFEDYSRRCRRLHFFSSVFDRDSLMERLRRGGDDELRDSYVGFIVLRPLPNAIFGRTVLKTYDQNSSRRYPTTRPYTASLFGCVLTVESLAFQEQDTVIAACATVALWSAFQKTADLFGSRMPTPAEITRSATASTFYSRPLPSRGLTLAQMAHAIKETGLEPEVIECRPSIPLLSAIYAYLSVGIPIILGVEIEGYGAHAVTVTGYSLSEEQAVDYERTHTDPPQPRRIGTRINQLFLHDDGFGPFVKVSTHAHDLPLHEGSAVYFEGTWKLPAVPGEAPKNAKLKPLYAIIPAYHKIRLTFSDIQPWIEAVDSVIRQTVAHPAESEWQTALVTNRAFKAAIRSWGLAQDTLDELLLRPLPRFLWQVTLELRNHPALELIFDATGIARSLSVVSAVFRHAGLRTAMRERLTNPGVVNRLTAPFAALLLSATDP